MKLNASWQAVFAPFDKIDGAPLTSSSKNLRVKIKTPSETMQTAMTLGRIELSTTCLEGKCSIQLS